jgi:hypothetical protein
MTGLEIAAGIITVASAIFGAAKHFKAKEYEEGFLDVSNGLYSTVAGLELYRKQFAKDDPRYIQTGEMIRQIAERTGAEANILAKVVSDITGLMEKHCTFATENPDERKRRAVEAVMAYESSQRHRQGVPGLPTAIGGAMFALILILAPSCCLMLPERQTTEAVVTESGITYLDVEWPETAPNDTTLYLTLQLEGGRIHTIVPIPSEDDETTPGLVSQSKR